MRRTTLLALLGCAVVSCKTNVPTTDASPGEPASEFRGVAIASAPSERPTAPVGGTGRESALLGLKAKLERKVDGGTATYQELRALLAVCSDLVDEACVERVQRMKDEKPWDSDAAIREYMTR